jgi:hypothetical protein
MAWDLFQAFPRSGGIGVQRRTSPWSSLATTSSAYGKLRSQSRGMPRVVWRSPDRPRYRYVPAAGSRYVSERYVWTTDGRTTVYSTKPWLYYATSVTLKGSKYTVQ